MWHVRDLTTGDTSSYYETALEFARGLTCNIAWSPFTQVTSALSIGLTPIPISFSVAKSLAEVFVIDDSSADLTIQRAASAMWAEGRAPLRVFSTPYNQGYGGNQRLGYLYAIARGFDIVVLLHGDGLYAPEYLPEILAEYSRSGSADAVYGSRFLRIRGAIKGRMPLYTFVGNRILTWLQNKILGTNLSEMHSGYRSYRTAALPGTAIADLGGADSGLLRFIDRLASSLARAWKGLFGYQILIEAATRPDSVDTLMSRTFLDKRNLRSAVAGTEMQDTGAFPLPASLR